MSAIRELPLRPSLEFERKEAKALLRRLRAGNTDALERARTRHPAIGSAAPGSIVLADAQLMIAREYGFTSWPKLVRYFGDLDRVNNKTGSMTHPGMWSPSEIEASVANFMKSHQNRRVSAWRALTAYVPRFYELPMEDVFQSTITEDEAKLAMARRQGFPSWEKLIERATQARSKDRRNEWEDSPVRLASKAMQSGDLGALQQLVETHPDLRHPNEYQLAVGEQLLRSALHYERQLGQAAMRPIIAWLETVGFDVQHELNVQLCGHMGMKPEDVRYLLDRGADPNWVAPNGITLLEHAIARYWNGEAIDLVAERTVPKKALWIAAGLGDVAGVSRFLDRHGRPTSKARETRPDFLAMTSHGAPWIPNAPDEEILMEAFSTAVYNSRISVVEYLVSRGFPVNSRVWDLPMLNIAVGNGWLPMVECLLRCGADLNLAGSYNGTARDMAKSMIENRPTSTSANYRRIAELCGVDPDAVLAERDARRLPAPTLSPKLASALDLASDDARRLGQVDVRPENLLFGLLRFGELPLMYFTKVGGMDFERFRVDVMERVQLGVVRMEGAALPMHDDAKEIIDSSFAVAAAHQREMVNGLHVLFVMTRTDQGIAGALLAKYGSSAARVNEELKRSI